MRMPLAILSMAHDREDIQAAIDCATALSEFQIRRGRAPLWWEDDARYARERHETLPGVERIQTAEELAAMGAGDCDDHAPALAASIRAIGGEARAVVIESPSIGYHVIVEATHPRTGDRIVIDPSARRGMLEPQSVGERRTIRRRRAGAFLRQAERLAAQAARLHPASRAAIALEEQAARMLARARAESRAEREDDDGTEETDAQD